VLCCAVLCCAVLCCVVLFCAVQYRRPNGWADRAENWHKHALGLCDEDRGRFARSAPRTIGAAEPFRAAGTKRDSTGMEQPQPSRARSKSVRHEQRECAERAARIAHNKCSAAQNNKQNKVA
jgi:hypothetical protein